MTLNTTSLSFRQEYHLLLFWVNCNGVKNLITNYTVGAGDTLQLFPPPPQWLTRHERGGWLGMENLCWLGTENLKGWLTRHGKTTRIFLCWLGTDVLFGSVGTKETFWYFLKAYCLQNQSDIGIHLHSSSCLIKGLLPTKSIWRISMIFP